MESEPTQAKPVNVVRRIGPPLVLLVVAGLCLVEFSMIRDGTALVRTLQPVESDDDLLSHDRVLGPEFRIFDWIRRELPPGTAISIDFENEYDIETLRRITRMWLALLPGYPVVSGANRRICPLDVCGEGDGTVLQRGSKLVLLRRNEP